VGSLSRTVGAMGSAPVDEKWLCAG